MQQATFQIVKAERERVDAIKVDPEYSLLVPILENEEHTKLRDSIAEVGLYEPLVINQDNVILDGHHRLKAVKELRWQEVEVQRKIFENRIDETIYVIETNVVRRQLNQAQRTLLGLKLEPLYSKKAEENMKAGVTLASSDARVDTDKFVAGKIGLSEGTYQRGKYVLANAPPEKKAKFLSGDKKAGSLYRELKKAEKIEQLRQEIPELVEPQGPFDVIVIDPPWPYGNEYDAEGDRSPTPYPQISLETLSVLKLPASEDCVLWLWTTNAFMHEAYHLLQAWGFTPKTILTWVKDRMGLGRWLRNQTEHCILAIKGTPIVDLKNQTTILTAKKRGHSVKPDEFYDLVDSLCIGSKVDWFSRRERSGWTSFGTLEMNNE